VCGLTTVVVTPSLRCGHDGGRDGRGRAGRPGRGLDQRRRGFALTGAFGLLLRESLQRLNAIKLVLRTAIVLLGLSAMAVLLSR
jgi:hypothetical protein